MTMKLGLGSAQLGMPYGIAGNRIAGNKILITEVLQLAATHHMTLIDTAPAYGNSQVLLRDCLPKQTTFQFISKMTLPEAGERFSVASLEEQLQTIFLQLGTSTLYALLIHNPQTLLTAEGKKAWDFLTQIKTQKNIQKLGVSVYTAAEIDACLAEWAIDIVQLPFNILDQRLLISGHLELLHDKNIEVHARSIFLQGLLLMDIDHIPAHLSCLKPFVSAVDHAAQAHHMSRLNFVLQFALQQSTLNKLIIGVNSKEELSAIINAATGAAYGLNNTNILACSNNNLIDPRLW